MFIHGGAWKHGDRKNFELGWLPSLGYAIASIEYRMSNEAVFPAQIHDCKGALRWLRAHQEVHGYDASKVVVAGHSAGGHLATLMGTSVGIGELEGTTAGHPDQSSAVQGVIDYFGPMDFVQRAKNQPQMTDDPKGIVYQLLGKPVTGNENLARLASPVTHAGAGDPPIIIFHGDADRQVLPEQSLLLFELWQANYYERQK
jgi:acetyl esterase/lipase